MSEAPPGQPSEDAVDRVQLGARLPRPLLNRLRRHAQASGRSIGYEIERAIEEYLERHSSPQRRDEIIQIVEEYLARQERPR